MTAASASFQLNEEFSQSTLVISEIKKFKELRSLNKKYNGLCEIICNYILITEIMNKGNGLLNKGSIKTAVTVQSLNCEIILKSHCLNVYSIFERVALFSGRGGSECVFSFAAKSKSFGSPEFDMLSVKLTAFNVGKIFKVLVYQKFGPMFLRGHSMLLMKSKNNKFVFFNPNAGLYWTLSPDGLRNLLISCCFGYSNLLVLDGDRYFLKLISRNLSLFP